MGFLGWRGEDGIMCSKREGMENTRGRRIWDCECYEARMSERRDQRAKDGWMKIMIVAAGPRAKDMAGVCQILKSWKTRFGHSCP